MSHRSQYVKKIWNFLNYGKSKRSLDFKLKVDVVTVQTNWPVIVYKIKVPLEICYANITLICLYVIMYSCELVVLRNEIKRFVEKERMICLKMSFLFEILYLILTIYQVFLNQFFLQGKLSKWKTKQKKKDNFYFSFMLSDLTKWN